VGKEAIGAYCEYEACRKATMRDRERLIIALLKQIRLRGRKKK